MPLLRQSRDGAATTEHFIVRMRGNYQDSIHYVVRYLAPILTVRSSKGVRRGSDNHSSHTQSIPWRRFAARPQRLRLAPWQGRNKLCCDRTSSLLRFEESGAHCEKGKLRRPKNALGNKAPERLGQI